MGSIKHQIVKWLLDNAFSRSCNKNLYVQNHNTNRRNFRCHMIPEIENEADELLRNRWANIGKYGNQTMWWLLGSLGLFGRCLVRASTTLFRWSWWSCGVRLNQFGSSSHKCACGTVLCRFLFQFLAMNHLTNGDSPHSSHVSGRQGRREISW